MAFADPSPCWDNITGLCCVVLTTAFPEPEPVASKNPDAICVAHGACWWAWVEEDGSDADANELHVARSLGTLVQGQEFESVAVTGDVSHPCIAFEPNGYLVLCYSQGGSLWQTISLDQGRTWQEPEELMTGTHGRLVVNERGDAMRGAVRDVSGTYYIYVQFFGGGDADWSEEHQVEFPVENDGFGLTYDHSTGGWLLFVIEEGETDRTVLLTTDRGVSWKEV